MPSRTALRRRWAKVDTNRLPLNLARFIVFDPRAPQFFLDWEDIADATAESLRAEAGRNPLDDALSELVEELSVGSAAFAAEWARHDVRHHRRAVLLLRSSSPSWPVSVARRSGTAPR